MALDRKRREALKAGEDIVFQLDTLVYEQRLDLECFVLLFGIMSTWMMIECSNES
jgi:hypothetical protein